MNIFPLGGIITLLVLLPNLLAVFFPPVHVKGEPKITQLKAIKVLTIFERIGQAGCFMTPFFYALTVHSNAQAAAAIIMAGALGIYYWGWARYLVLGRSEHLFYRSILGIPVPMAVMPVLYFLLASLLLGSVWLLMASILLGIGHLSISWINGSMLEGIQKRKEK